MSFVAVAIGGAGLVTGVLGYEGAKSAANTQAQAANNALNFQQQVYNNNQTQLQPFITAGQGATNTLSQLANGNYASFTTSPDYNFALQQGTRGVTNYENAQGMGLSGGALKDIANFNQGLATQQYGNYFNRLMQIAQLGGNAAGSLAGNNTQAASNIGNTMQGVGQAQASGIVGGTNAITGGINSGISNSLLASALGKSPSAYGNIGSMPATGAGAPGDFSSNLYAMSQGINPF